MTRQEKLEQIHESLVNGQRKQMVEQIDEFGLYDFWEEYKKYLYQLYCMASQLEHFTDATISYFRIKNR